MGAEAGDTAMSRKYEEGPIFEFSCLKKRETDAAVLIVDIDSGEEIWIPLSQVSELHFRNDSAGGLPVGTIVMTEWIAKKKGLL